MTPQQIQAAEAVSKLRVLKYKNDPLNDLIGALGEVAVSAWAVVSGIHPVDDAFKDPSRDSGADLYLGSKNVSVDVKSSSAGDIYTYPEKQISTLKAKASAVIGAPSSRSPRAGTLLDTRCPFSGGHPRMMSSKLP